MGQAQPPKDSLSAEAQRVAAVNEGATKQSQSAPAGTDPSSQSAADRQENFEQVAADLAPKVDDQTVTKEEADLLHSREHRAYGETQKGGIASQAQSIASEKK